MNGLIHIRFHLGGQIVAFSQSIRWEVPVGRSGHLSKNSQPLHIVKSSIGLINHVVNPIDGKIKSNIQSIRQNDFVYVPPT